MPDLIVQKSLLVNVLLSNEVVFSVTAVQEQIAGSESLNCFLNYFALFCCKDFVAFCAVSGASLQQAGSSIRYSCLHDTDHTVRRTCHLLSSSGFKPR